MFKFVEGQGTNLTSAKNPQFTVVNSITRQWIDADEDFVPDCNLMSLAQNGECAAGNPLFGQTTTPTTVRDDATLHGWGNRSGVNWEFSTSVQHELLPNFSVNVGYFRRMWSRFLSTDNLLVTPADYSPYCTTAPVDSRLPGGGGYEICGLYDISREKFNQVNAITTWGEKFGEEKELYQGVDFNVNARLKGTTVQGGVNLGRTETDDCSVIIDNPQKHQLPDDRSWPAAFRRPGHCRAHRTGHDVQRPVQPAGCASHEDGAAARTSPSPRNGRFLQPVQHVDVPDPQQHVRWPVAEAVDAPAWTICEVWGAARLLS
jgi:hypothetical protein